MNIKCRQYPPPPHPLSSSLLTASSNCITLPGGSTWEPPLWQHTSCLASSLQVELTSQESGAGFDTSRGITQGRFVLHSHCQLSHEDAKCHVRLEKQKVWGSRVPPFSRPLVQHTSYNIYMMISYVVISGHENAHTTTSRPRSSVSHTCEQGPLIWLPLLTHKSRRSSSPSNICSVHPEHKHHKYLPEMDAVARSCSRQCVPHLSAL